MSNGDAPRLSHLDDEGRLRMVDIGEKAVTRREAIAVASVRMSRSTLDLLARNALPKGDVLTTAKIAGILAAKRTSDLVPLTHPLALELVDVELEVDAAAGIVRIRSTVRCEGKTGAEIEAMTAAAVAALTVYDMCKSAEQGIVIESIALARKSGGRSGVYERES